MRMAPSRLYGSMSDLLSISLPPLLGRSSTPSLPHQRFFVFFGPCDPSTRTSLPPHQLVQTMIEHLALDRAEGIQEILIELTAQAISFRHEPPPCRRGVDSELAGVVAANTAFHQVFGHQRRNKSGQRGALEHRNINNL